MLTAMIVRFTKMHGAGNDFVVIDTIGPAESFDADAPGVSGRRELADRATGIGCDQLLVIEPPRNGQTDAWIRIFNADGREAAQCGNGLRCIARYLSDRYGRTRWRLDGVAGPVDAVVQAGGSVSVDMGIARRGAGATGCHTAPPWELDGEPVDFALISMGNPHAVCFVGDVADAPVERWGSAVQQYFSDGVNVGFAAIRGDSRLALRVWERGVGETRACGTGACAAVVAAIERTMPPGEIAVDLPGGQLMVKCTGLEESVWLTGPAKRVFEGQFET